MNCLLVFSSLCFAQPRAVASLQTSKVVVTSLLVFSSLGKPHYCVLLGIKKGESRSFPLWEMKKELHSKPLNKDLNNFLDVAVLLQSFQDDFVLHILSELPIVVVAILSELEGVRADSVIYKYAYFF